MKTRALIAFLTLFFFPFAVLCADDSGRTLIQNRGSDSMAIAVVAWAEAYKEVNPNLAVAVSGGGSGTGISAMINGTVDLANSSRSMRESELEAARGNGVEPLEHVVGFDALAVYLHPDNPIDGMTSGEIRSVFTGEITSWSELGGPDLEIGSYLEGQPAWGEAAGLSAQTSPEAATFLRALGLEDDAQILAEFYRTVRVKVDGGKYFLGVGPGLVNMRARAAT